MSGGREDHELAEMNELKKVKEVQSPPPDPSQPVGDRCFLFEISAELRNRIYKYTLIASDEDDPIVITRDTFEQPGLLRSCHQIRGEASKIYYQRNSFDFDIGDWNPTIVRAFCQQDKASWWDNYDNTYKWDTGFSVHTDRAPWRNVLKWLEWYHKDEMFTAPSCSDGCEHKNCLTCVIEGAIDIVDRLGKGSWEDDILPMLEIYRKGARAGGADLY